MSLESVLRHQHTGSNMAYLLLLPLSVLWNEVCEALVDATLGKELLELVLDGDIECVELIMMTSRVSIAFR